MIQKEKPSGKIYDIKIIKRLAKFLKKEKYLIIIAGIISTFIIGIQLILPLLIRTAIDKYIINTAQVIKIKPEDAQRYKDILMPIKGDKWLVKTTDVKKIEVPKEVEERVYFLFDKKKASELNLKPELQSEKFIAVSFERIKEIEAGVLKVLRAADLRGLRQIALIFLLLIIVRFLFSFLQIFLMEYSSQKMMHRLRITIFSHFLKVPVPYFDKNPTGRLVTRNTNDVEAINQLFSEVMPSLFQDFFLLVGIFIFLPIINLKLALITFVVLPPILFITLYFRKKIRNVFREVREKLTKINAFLQENISGVKVVKMFNKEKKRYDEFKIINNEYYQANFREVIVFAVYRPLIDFFATFSVALLIFFGGGGVMTLWVSVGTLTAFLNYVEYLFQPIRDLSEKFNLLQNAMAAGEKIFTVLDTPKEDYKGKEIKKIKGEIAFKNVWFAYNDNDYVLKDVSFEVHQGEKVAIVGATGAGKTTLINLLCRFYEPKKGEILLDGEDIKKLSKRFLRSQMAMVTQDIFLFSGTIKDNIKLRSNKTSQEVEEAAILVNAHKFIEKREKRYEEEVKERGANLSLGERQLVALARALIFNPKVLILDEATSNIDPQTENLIQQGLKKLLKGRTALIIAHRFSTIKNADRIIVLHEGRIREKGTYKELMQKKGYFYTLYRLQFERNIKAITTQSPTS